MAEKKAAPTIADSAADVRAQHDYNGTLTVALLNALFSLLNEPVDPKYIETTRPTKGKPYESTGIRSVQVQIDRLNEVLGPAHWRVLTHYQDGGALCRTVLVVGNDLRWCRLDERGELVPWTESGVADVLAVRDGWGGHSRGSNRGDLYKGSETNALKRTIARLGPGGHVYRLDFDDDVNRSNDDEVRVAPQTPPPLVMLDELLADDSTGLGALRQEANAGMERYGVDARGRVERLLAAPSEADLRALIARVNAAMDADAAAGE